MVFDITAGIEQKVIKENDVKVDKLLLKMKETCEQVGKIFRN